MLRLKMCSTSFVFQDFPEHIGNECNGSFIVLAAALYFNTDSAMWTVNTKGKRTDISHYMKHYIYAVHSMKHLSLDLFGHPP